jgi:predicted dehydrogenase
MGANDQIRVAIVGLRGKGKHHAGIFNELPNVTVAAICDVDTDIIDREVKKFEAIKQKIKTYIDYRKVLEDKDIDAVVIATPNHWHSLMGIWACQAGKDAYVEKPISHNVWEGEKLVQAARKYERIVQAGTQSRSDEALPQVFDYINQGNLGKIEAAYGLCYKRRNSIGKVNGPQPIPKTINYDLWCGPAPLEPLRRSRVHYDWHWVWDTGNGDIGNQGIHQMDQCRWALGEGGFPRNIISFGGRFGYDDDGETPNSQIAIFDYEKAPLIFEVQGLPRKKGDNSMGHCRGVRVGLVVKCEWGYFAGSNGGGWVYDNKGKKIKQFTGSGGEGHAANFIKAVRSRKVGDLNADIHVGHVSSALCHLGNISYRLGQLSEPEALEEASNKYPQSLESLNRFKDNLFSNWIDLKKDMAALGPALEFDTKKNRFVEHGEYSLSRWANDMISQRYRKPFVVPEKV